MRSLGFLLSLALHGTVTLGLTCDGLLYAPLSVLDGNAQASSLCASRLSTLVLRSLATTSEIAKVTKTQSTNKYSSLPIATRSLSSRSSQSTGFKTVSYTVSKVETDPTTKPTTTTILVQSNLVAAKHRLRKSNIEKANQTSIALASLSSLSGDILATACSCIEASATPSPKTQALHSRNTNLTAPAGTGRTNASNLNSTNKANAPTIASNSSVSTTISSTNNTTSSTINTGDITNSTSTTNFTLPGSLYNHIWGPTPGCEDNHASNAYQIDNRITSVQDATQKCMDYCTKDPRCAVLYVQLMFPSWGPTTPYYKCFLDHHGFDNGENLLCGLDQAVWGNADVYQYVGRTAS